MATLLANYTTTSTLDNLGNANLKIGESFLTPNDGINYFLYSAKFSIKKVGTPSGVLTAVLYAHTGTFGTSSLPTGSALATSTTSLGEADLTTSFVEYELLFDGTYQMTANTAYCLSLESSTDSGVNYFQLQDIHSNGAGSPSGQMIYYQSSWGNLPWDVYYAVYGTAPTSGPANLKSLDTNLKANIKSWNTNLIANIKSINTNT